MKTEREGKKGVKMEIQSNFDLGKKKRQKKIKRGESQCNSNDDNDLKKKKKGRTVWGRVKFGDVGHVVGYVMVCSLVGSAPFLRR